MSKTHDAAAVPVSCDPVGGGAHDAGLADPEAAAALAKLAAEYGAPRLVGRGAHGAVYALNKTLAAKVVVYTSESAALDFANEVVVHTMLADSRAVVAVYPKHCYAMPRWGVLLLARFDQTLYDRMAVEHAAGTLANFHLYTWARIASSVRFAIREMAQRGVTHMDLHPHNIAVSHTCHDIRVYDFGSAHYVAQSGLPLTARAPPCADYDAYFFVWHYDHYYRAITGTAPHLTTDDLPSLDAARAVCDKYGDAFRWKRC